jgi:hypothetical protein
MSLDSNLYLNAIISHALRLGRFDAVNGHEPKSAPSNGLTASVWLNRISPTQSSGLASSSARVEFNVRLQMAMLHDPQDSIDPIMMTAIDELITAYAGDFTFGEAVRAVDLRGMDGEGLSAQAGYITQDNRTFRVYDITLPLIVNDAWSESE